MVAFFTAICAVVPGQRCRDASRVLILIEFARRNPASSRGRRPENQVISAVASSRQARISGDRITSSDRPAASCTFGQWKSRRASVICISLALLYLASRGAWDPTIIIQKRLQHTAWLSISGSTAPLLRTANSTISPALRSRRALCRAYRYGSESFWFVMHHS